MANSFFQFKQFIIHQDQTAMKVTTDSCFFGAWVANEIQSIRNASNLLDIGAGTGLLSLMIAQKNEIEIDAVEIDKNAAAQARENISVSKWKNRVHLLESDILQLRGDKKYSIIVSNPPFYENELSSPNETRNVAHHSEQLTLEQLIATIKQRLLPNGEFFLLLPFKRDKEFLVKSGNYGLHLNKRVVVKQSANHKGFRILVRGSFVHSMTINSEIDIRDEQHNYTPSFTELLKDYYLYL